ncbi:MAG TPA: Uma2 family endonuclease [Candidatus Obscuribacterales bacterium]
MAGTILTPVKWSLERYHQMAAAGVLEDYRVELLDGDIVEMTPVDPPHEERGDAVAEHLRQGLGRRVLVREGKAITLPTSEPIPDVAVVERRSYGDHHPYPENIYLLIEIANSRPERDIDVKRPIYARAGIVEYWVFDLVNDEFRVFRGCADGDYQTDIPWTEPTITLQAFPDVVLSVSAMKQLTL